MNNEFRSTWFSILDPTWSGFEAILTVIPNDTILSFKMNTDHTYEFNLFHSTVYLLCDVACITLYIEQFSCHKACAM